MATYFYALVRGESPIATRIVIAFVVATLFVAQFLAWRRVYTRRVLKVSVNALEPYFDGLKIGVRIVNADLVRRGISRDWKLAVQEADGATSALLPGHQEGIRIDPIEPEGQSFITAYFPSVPQRDAATKRFVVIGADIHGHESRSEAYPFHRVPPWPLIRSIEGPV